MRVLAIIARVCVTHAGVVSKRLNVGSLKQHHVIAQGLFLKPTVGGQPPLPPEICSQNDPHPTPIRTPKFSPIPGTAAIRRR